MQGHSTARFLLKNLVNVNVANANNVSFSIWHKCGGGCCVLLKTLSSGQCGSVGWSVVL